MKHISEVTDKILSQTRSRVSKFRTPYDNHDNATPGIDCGPGLTKQSFSEECDINNIMRRFEETGQLPEMIRTDPQYGEFADMPSFQEAQNIVIRSQEQFSALPAKVRSKFQNDPALFLDYVNNPENQAELIKMGLATERAKDAQPVQSAAPPSPASSAPVPKASKDA